MDPFGETLLALADILDRRGPEERLRDFMGDNPWANDPAIQKQAIKLLRDANPLGSMNTIEALHRAAGRPVPPRYAGVPSGLMPRRA